jgi:predicted dehydrogenase
VNPSSSKTLKIGVIGAGFIGQQHVEAIRRIPGTKVVALADNNLDMLQTKANLLGIQSTYSDYREMLLNPEIDIIHNCTPNYMHYEVNKAIIESGKHVYSEKPLAVNTDESGDLVKIAEKYQVANGVNFNYRHNAVVQEMHQRISAGKAGHPLLVHGQYLQDWLMFDTDFDWRIDPKMGGPSRAIADIGSHWFDTAQFVLNKKIKSVFANLTTIHPKRKHYLKREGTFATGTGELIEEMKVSSEDVAFIMLRFEDGIPGYLIVSQVSAGHKNDLRLTVDGSAYAMEWQQENADKLWIGHRDEPNQQLICSPGLLSEDAKRYATLPGGHSVAWADAFRNGIQEFYHSVRNDTYRNQEQSYATFLWAHRIMKIVEACLESNQQKSWIDIHED